MTPINFKQKYFTLGHKPGLSTIIEWNTFGTHLVGVSIPARISIRMNIAKDQVKNMNIITQLRMANQKLGRNHWYKFQLWPKNLIRSLSKQLPPGL